MSHFFGLQRRKLRPGRSWDLPWEVIRHWQRERGLMQALSPKLGPTCWPSLGLHHSLLGYICS
jgi:hypothetical protein